MAMYMNLSSQNEAASPQNNYNDNTCSPPQSPAQSQIEAMNQEQNALALTGNKRKTMDKDGGSSGKLGGYKTIDPLSLLQDEKFNSFKRQRLDNSGSSSSNNVDYSVPLTTNDDTFTSSYVFMHTISRPASQSATPAPAASVYSYQTPLPEEERILREEFYAQQLGPSGGFSLSTSSSGSLSNLAGYALPAGYPQTTAPPPPSPYMLPSFMPAQMQPSPVPHYNNGYYPSDLYYPRSEVSPYRQSAYPPSLNIGSGIPVSSCTQSNNNNNQEEFVGETKLSKNIKKMTTVLSQIPGLEKIRWQSILQGTRSPDVGERETQRRVKEAETIGARLFGGDIDKLLGSILNQHLDFLVTFVANLKNGKKKHNKLRMQLSKVLQDAAAANSNNSPNDDNGSSNS